MVLVAHSFGGYLAEMAARTIVRERPGFLRGLVLLDSSTLEVPSPILHPHRLWELWKPAIWGLQQLSELTTGRVDSAFTTAATAVHENSAFRSTARLTRIARHQDPRGLDATPITVVTALRPLAWHIRRLPNSWYRRQARMAEQLAAEHKVIMPSGHHVMIEHPKQVADTITSLVASGQSTSRDAGSAQAAGQFQQASEQAAVQVISTYSSSFSLAARLLHEPVRTHVRNLYAMVRVGDEIVDGAAAGSGLSAAQTGEVLDDYEQRVFSAVDTGFSSDPILHAFAWTARENDFATQDIRDFFSSMRADIHTDCHSDTSIQSYIHGSAEVIGLMCTAIFDRDATRTGRPWTEDERVQAREAAMLLGRAFQRVNFLRDLSEDASHLGRIYLPEAQTDGNGVPKNSDPRPRPAVTLSEAQKTELTGEIARELAAAREGIPLLPPSARAGVLAAHDIFAELNQKIARVPAERLIRERVRIPAAHKAVLVARAIWRTRHMA